MKSFGKRNRIKIRGYGDFISFLVILRILSLILKNNLTFSSAGIF
ncbi:MAG: hypothetical protein QMC93_01325 [Patescibacteria group bacterium]|nr:hypothetical protein [Patescibacteria group bacterium]